jgi:hypothetical protein
MAVGVEHPAEGRTEDEAEGERRAEDAERLRATFRRRDVGIPPAMTRERRSIQKSWAKAKSTYDAVEPTRPMRRTGRRPIRSESEPQSGETSNCSSEKLVMSTPIWAGEMCAVAAYAGISGSTIPNPTRSMKTMVKTTASCLRIRGAAELGAAA